MARRFLAWAMMGILAAGGLVVGSPVAVNWVEDVRADLLAVSGTGNATAATNCGYVPLPGGVPSCPGGAAVSGTGRADACRAGAYACAGSAVSGTGDATACGSAQVCTGVAASGSGDAAANASCVQQSYYQRICTGGAAASGLGDSRGVAALSGTGDATGTPACATLTYYADACAPGVAASGTGNASGDVAVSGTGRAQGRLVGASGCSANTPQLCPGGDLARATVPTDLALGPDADRDGVPSRATLQFTEFIVRRDGTIATRSSTQNVTLDGNDNDPNVPAPSVVRVPAPGNVTLGPDRDRDGVPRDASVEVLELAVDRRDGSVARRTVAVQVVTLDPDDDDPETPLPSVLRAVVTTSAQPGADGDRDGVPATLEVQQTEVAFDRRDGSVATEERRSSVPLDPDDGNPDVPARSVVRATLAMNATLGPDADRDGVPATVVVERAEVAFDRRDASVSSAPAANLTVPLDPNDRDPETPAPSLLVAAVPSNVTLGADADRDGVPAEAFVESLVVLFDRRDQSVRTFTVTQRVALDPDDQDPNRPVASVVTARVAVPAAGRDADRDGVPSALVLEQTEVTFDRRDGNLTTRPASQAVFRLDPDDGDANNPAPSVVRATAPSDLTAGPDGDRDGVPAYATVESTEVALDRRDGNVTTRTSTQRVNLDPNDNNPNTPVQSVVQATVPSNATLGPDGDRDGVPASVVLTQTQLSFDRRDANLTARESRQSVVLDPDDGNPDVPAPSVVRATAPTRATQGPDEDRDGVPATLLLTQTELSLDRRDGNLTTRERQQEVALDPNDRDPNVPAPSVVRASAPTNVAAGPDADQDGLPAYVVVTSTEVAFDRRDGNTTTREVQQRVNVDPDDNRPEQVGANAFGDARGGTIAVSGTGNASACTGTLTCVAVSGAGRSSGYWAVSLLGDAAGCSLDFLCTAASGTGDAQADDLAVSGLGDAQSGDLALSGLGSAHGTTPLSGSNRCNEGLCFDAQAGDATAQWVALSATGNSQGLLAASALGGAAGGLAGVSAGGAATGGLIAASGAGDATSGLAAASATGDARGGLLAVSGTGHADGQLAVSGCDAAGVCG